MASVGRTLIASQRSLFARMKVMTILRHDPDGTIAVHRNGVNQDEKQLGVNRASGSIRIFLLRRAE